MTRHHIASAISSAAQEYLLALRVMAVDGSKVTAAQVGRHLGVTTQAASEMFRRLAADGVTEGGVSDVDLGDGTTRLDIVHAGWERLGSEGGAWREANFSGWAALRHSFIPAAEA